MTPKYDTSHYLPLDPGLGQRTNIDVRPRPARHAGRG